MPLSRSSVGPALAAAASILLHGCGPIENALETSSAPTGQPPPAGFAADMLAAHNAVRADPASVGGSPAPSPALAPLAWNSTEVAARAQAWASGCDYRHDTTALRALGYGENIAAAYPPGSFATADVVSGLWGGEAPFYAYATNTCDSANPGNTAHTCGHYTQLVWRGTTVVGCGFATCTEATWPFGSGTPGPWDYWVCDYAPPGNYVGERPY